MKRLIFPLIAVLSFMTVSCGDDEPSIPSNAISLNMPNEDNGQTRLGFSDVYINSSDNFVGREWSIVDMGKKGGFKKEPETSQIAQEVAVTPGHFYQLLPHNALSVIGGERALAINSGFYNVYVNSWLRGDNGNIIGANVSFSEYRPKNSGLLDWDSNIGIQMHEGFDNVERAEFSFRKGFVFDNVYEIYNMGNSDLRTHLEITIKENTISFANVAWVPNGAAEVVIKVRHGNLYTRVRFIVKTAA